MSTALEIMLARMTASALRRIDDVVEHRAQKDLRVISAMAEVARRGLGQRFRYAAAHVRAIQLGGKK